MNINKIFFLLVLILCFSCEKDDICLENMDIKANIGFYKYDTKQNAEIVLDSIVGLNNKPLYKKINVKQVFLSLKIDDKKTTFTLHKDNIVDTLYFEYDTEQQFVSKPCGFRVIYRNMNCKLSKDPKIIKQVEVSSKDVINKNEHIKAYF